MATTIVKARHQLAVKTEAEWQSANPTLRKGEVAFSSDKEYQFKVGNGTSTWTQLSYAARGPQGAKGDTGATGTRGSIWNVGTACTGTSSTGAVFATGISSSLVGDLYLNTSTGYVYRCTTAGNASTAKWSYIGSIRGAKGDTGSTGTRGSRWNSGTACTGTSTTGTVFATGITDALVNDYYLNTSTGYVYRCTTAGNASTAKWSYAGSIKGVKGDKGDTGDTGAKGDTGDPGVTLHTWDLTITATSFSGSGPYTQTVTVSGLLTSDQIIIGYMPQSTASADANAAKSYAMLSSGTCSTNGQLILRCLSKKPTTNFKIRVLALRAA